MSQEKIMFENLPKDIQEQIAHYLNMNNFAAAKALYDAWRRQG